MNFLHTKRTAGHHFNSPAKHLKLAILVACSLVWLCVLSRADAQPDAAAKNPYVDVVFAGDIMLDGLPGEAIARGEDPFVHVASILKAADIAIGNLECVVATGGQPEDKSFTFRAHPRVMPLLGKHFQAMSFANNHSGDYGHDAFLEQILYFERQSLKYFGGGENCARARTPAILEVKGIRFAFLGYDEFRPRSFEAGPTWPGVAWSVDEQVTADIRAARVQHKVDIVIPFMHWGWEHEPANDRQKALARLMIESGADAVVGAHPHVTQETEYHQGKLALYSLGNFVFDGFDEGPARIGWMLRLRIDKEGVLAWDTIVVRIDDNGIPHVLRDEPSPCGTRKSPKIELRRGLVDSPLSGGLGL